MTTIKIQEAQTGSLQNLGGLTFFGTAQKHDDADVVHKHGEASRFALYVISMLATEPLWAYISYGQSADPQDETPNRLYVELQSFYTDCGTTKAPDVDKVAAWLERSIKSVKGDGFDALSAKVEQVYEALHSSALPQKCFSNDVVAPVAEQSGPTG